MRSLSLRWKPFVNLKFKCVIRIPKLGHHVFLKVWFSFSRLLYKSCTKDVHLLCNDTYKNQIAKAPFPRLLYIIAQKTYRDYRHENENGVKIRKMSLKRYGDPTWVFSFIVIDKMGKKINAIMIIIQWRHYTVNLTAFSTGNLSRLTSINWLRTA